jgi:hypothetical protein
VCLVGVLCVLSSGCEVINSEGRTTSVVCSEVTVYSHFTVEFNWCWFAVVGCGIGVRVK